METGCPKNGVLLLIHSPPGTPLQATAVMPPLHWRVLARMPPIGRLRFQALMVFTCTCTARGCGPRPRMLVHTVFLFAVYIYKSIVPRVRLLIYIIKNEELKIKNGRQRAGPLCRSEIPRGYAPLDDSYAVQSSLRALRSSPDYFRIASGCALAMTCCFVATPSQSTGFRQH